ncbi:MAG: molybdopterin-dependent oxidoreductase [Treponema sp.]|nr:molybdopterin-dependent oxidoreductase [Treponema sp.]
MKKMKVTLFVTAFLLMTVICCAGGRAATAQPEAAPSSAAPVAATPESAAPVLSPIPEWTLTIVTPAGEKLFSSVDAAALSRITMEATLRNSRGEESTNTYTGVKLADVLRAVGVSDFTGLSIIAADDFSVSYTRDLALADDTLIAWEVDGEAYTTEPPLRMAPKQGVGNQYIRQPVRIVIN